MVVEWAHVRQVILNDRINGYKPDRAVIDKLVKFFPDIRILGFKKYYEFHWSILVESIYFPADISADISAIPMTQIIQFAPKIFTSGIA